MSFYILTMHLVDSCTNAGVIVSSFLFLFLLPGTAILGFRGGGGWQEVADGDF